MGKKILGYLFYVLGFLCIMSFYGNLKKSLTIKAVQNSNIELAEDITALILAGILALVFFKYAIKWTKNKSKDEINEIGK